MIAALVALVSALAGFGLGWWAHGRNRDRLLLAELDEHKRIHWPGID